MADVKVAQIGQTAVNQPFVEVNFNGQRFVFSVDESNRVTFRNRAFLLSMGVNSMVCKQYADAPTPELIKLMKLNNGSAIRPVWISAQTLGTGYAFSVDFDPRTGWKSLYPSGSLVFQV